MAKKKQIEVIQNNALLNLISPQGLRFSPKDIEISDNKAKAYGIIKYPATLNYGWLSKITNIDNSLVSIVITSYSIHYTKLYEVE